MDDSNRTLRKHAIVIGGSIGGLLTARVLRDHFQQVTILEHDSFSEDDEPRKGVPQGKSVHVLFGGGIRVINQLFPGFFGELVEKGAVVCDFSKDLCWYHGGVWKARPASDLVSYWQSRPFLESNLRRRLQQETDIQILEQCAVTGLRASPDRTRITGVKIRRIEGEEQTEEMEADLVVDASGRGSQVPAWLESFGYARPDETTVKVDIGYASRIFETPQDATRDWQIMALYGTPPKSTRTGYIFPIEGGRWLVSEVGFLKDFPPGDEQGFLEFARSMELPDFYEAIKNAKPLTPISTFRFPANRWRRYDRLRRFPAGLLVIGDAISTFNPVYGQGMSVCSLEVQELRRLFEKYETEAIIPGGLARDFFRAAAVIIETPWMLATQSDFLYPQTSGKRPLYTNPLNWYLTRVLQLCSGNDRVVKTFYEVLHFIKRPTAFFHPSVLFPVLGRSIGLKRFYDPSKQRPRLNQIFNSGMTNDSRKS